jgi:hypothetical protein
VNEEWISEDTAAHIVDCTLRDWHKYVRDWQIETRRWEGRRWHKKSDVLRLCSRDKRQSYRKRRF